MKHILLIILFSFFILSCSDDNTLTTMPPEEETVIPADTIPANGEPLPEEGQDSIPEQNTPDVHLIKMVQKRYNSGTVSGINVFEYTNSKPFKFSYYTAQNELTAYTMFLYNSNGYVSSTATYNPGGALLTDTTYEYDSLSRLTAVTTHEGSYTSVTSFIYNNNNNNNTITATNVNQGTSVKIFYLNSNGIIYKEVSGNTTYEIQFDGFNPVSAESNNGIFTQFEYDNEHDASAIALYNNPTGPYMPNRVLMSGILMDKAGACATKYLLKEINGSDVKENIYIFNTSNLPQKISTYSNQVLRSEAEYFYQ